jgi:hypothetical protein
MMKPLLTVLALALVAGCGSEQPDEFDRVCQELSVRPNVARNLREFRQNRDGDNTSRFEILRAFCMRRQLAAPRHERPELADPILDTNTVVVLLGQPNSISDSLEWTYFFNAERNWKLELSFRDGKLFHTSFGQLVSADQLGTELKQRATNQKVDHIN